MQRVRKMLAVPPVLPEAEEQVTIAVLDTGVGRHPDLQGCVVCFRDFVGYRNLMYDNNGHGTHVCGILCGSGLLSDGRYAGMAPGTKLAVGKVLDERGDGSTEAMLKGLDWILDVKNQYNIRILNISVGIGDLESWEKERALKNKIEQVWDSGILVVCAAGNKGPGNGTISAVGSSYKVVTVGCHDGSYGRDNPGRCETYSGRGDLAGEVRKPDLVAPGTEVISCNANFRRMNGRIKNAYTAKSGTSMATPIVSGAAALTFRKYPEMTNEECKQKMQLTADDLGIPWNRQGWGMINVGRLLN